MTDKKLAPHLAAASRNSTTELVKELREWGKVFRLSEVESQRRTGVLMDRAADEIEFLGGVRDKIESLSSVKKGASQR
jgi:hypothetical protein